MEQQEGLPASPAIPRVTHPVTDPTGKALREYGRLVETNFILRRAGDPALRRRAHGALNKHENSIALHRAISYGNRGRVRARDPETVQRLAELRSDDVSADELIARADGELLDSRPDRKPGRSRHVARDGADHAR